MFNSQPVFGELEENFGDLLDAFDEARSTVGAKVMLWLSGATAGLLAASGAGFALAEWVMNPPAL